MSRSLCWLVDWETASLALLANQCSCRSNCASCQTSTFRRQHVRVGSNVRREKSSIPVHQGRHVTVQHCKIRRFCCPYDSTRNPDCHSVWDMRFGFLCPGGLSSAFHQQTKSYSFCRSRSMQALYWLHFHICWLWTKRLGCSVTCEIHVRKQSHIRILPVHQPHSTSIPVGSPRVSQAPRNWKQKTWSVCVE